MNEAYRSDFEKVAKKEKKSRIKLLQRETKSSTKSR